MNERRLTAEICGVKRRWGTNPGTGLHRCETEGKLLERVGAMLRTVNKEGWRFWGRKRGR